MTNPISSPPASNPLQPDVFDTTKEGQTVYSVTLTNDCGITCTFITHGARLTEWHTPDNQGNFADVVLCFDDLEILDGEGCSFGCTTGPVAGRINQGLFTLDGQTIELEGKDAVGNHLHGGWGLMRRLWSIDESSLTANSVRFIYHSPDGEAGYPGNVDFAVTYHLTDAGGLEIAYEATTDQATPINLTNHTYFNLGGVDHEPASKMADELMKHVVTIDSDYTLASENSIPTGELVAVKGTPLDFNEPHAIGDRIGEITEGERPGYDHVWVLRDATPTMKQVATAYHPESGRKLTVETDEPVCVFYTSNFWDGGLPGKRGVVYPYRGGFCMETQKHPDAVNHETFPDVILRPGQTYRQHCTYTITTD